MQDRWLQKDFRPCNPTHGIYMYGQTWLFEELWAQRLPLFFTLRGSFVGFEAPGAGRGFICLQGHISYFNIYIGSTYMIGHTCNLARTTKLFNATSIRVQLENNPAACGRPRASGVETIPLGAYRNRATLYVCRAPNHSGICLVVLVAAISVCMFSIALY